MCGGDKANPISPAAKFPPSPSPPLLLQQTFNVKEMATLSVCCSPTITSSQIFAGLNFFPQNICSSKIWIGIFRMIWRWIIELDAGLGDWRESQFGGRKESESEFWSRFVFSPFRASESSFTRTMFSSNIFSQIYFRYFKWQPIFISIHSMMNTHQLPAI